MDPQAKFEALQARWRKADHRERELAYQLRQRHGAYLIGCPHGQREKLARASDAEARAAEAIFSWLDACSPRSWRRGCPSSWVCDHLTYADAVTAGPLSVIPPPAYGCYPDDMLRFARPVGAA